MQLTENSALEVASTPAAPRGVLTGIPLDDVRRLRLPPSPDPFGRLRPPPDLAALRLSLELSYLTGGLSWRADYVANLAADEKTMDLSGWVTLTNQSRGMEGPGFLQVGYGADGRMNQIAGELSSAGKRVAFDLSLAWASGRKASTIVSVPPPSARKVSREELEVSLLAGLAGNILELQRAGLNLRSVPLAGK